MEEKIFIGLVISVIIAIATMYAKMILINRDVQLQIHERCVNDWSEVNKLYLQIVSTCDEKPIENVTYKQMHERISKPLNIDSVIDCKHENEKMHQGDGFVYVTCADCGEDL